MWAVQTPTGQEILAIAALAGVLVFAVVRPKGLPEVVAAGPAAALLIAAGAIPASRAWAEAVQLAPVVIFLGAILVLGHLCEEEGLFEATSDLIARASRGRPTTLLGYVFVLAAVSTAILSLDATVVLLTPVVFATAVRLGVRPRPHVYACGHLANSASLLLPVSNLTNLLVLQASGLGFARFAGLMALPWLVSLGIEYAAFRWFFSTDLSVSAGTRPAPGGRTVPVFAAVVVLLTLAGFVGSSSWGVDPAWVAVGGAVVLGARSLFARRSRARDVARAVNLPFLVFVIALGVVVRAVVDNGLSGAIGHLIPSGQSLSSLMLMALLAAVLANVVNNLPAVLVLLPLAGPNGPGAILAVLIGVNIGPNLTYVGSLATLLWRRIVRDHDHQTEVREFTLLGLLTVPASLVACSAALWVSLQVSGG